MSSYIHPTGYVRSITVGAVRTHDSGNGAQFHARSITITLGDGSTMEISSHGATADALRILDEQGRELTAASPPAPAISPAAQAGQWQCPECGRLSRADDYTCGHCGYMPSATERSVVCSGCGRRDSYAGGECTSCGCSC